MDKIGEEMIANIVLILLMLTPVPTHRDFQYSHGWMYSSEWGYVVEMPDNLSYDYYSVPDITFRAVDGGWSILDSEYSPTVMLAFLDDENHYIGIIHFGSGKLFFVGNMEESAKEFFRFLKPYIDEYIREKLNEEKNEKTMY